ncbi:hypothetical protein [Fodinibius sp. SL11]|uniref:hypothetical protein n=1 Tax=Fodinibius sp. SL11 TaxID=3425690 RepID=UPI003F883BE1
MKGLIHFYLVTTILCISYMNATGQGASGAKKDGRFTANVSGVAPLNVDKVGLMKGFDLRLQWWTLLGEPMEYYHFRWHTSNEYKIDGNWIKRTDLEKYPDLLKRFDNIRPIKVNLEIKGNFDGFVSNSETENDPKIQPFFSSLTSDGSFSNHSDFRYRINDIRLMRAKSGVWGKAITPTSPLNWEHFLEFWIFTKHVALTNDSLNDTKGLTEQELELRRNQMKTLFRESTQIIELYAEDRDCDFTLRNFIETEISHNLHNHEITVLTEEDHTFLYNIDTGRYSFKNSQQQEVSKSTIPEYYVYDPVYIVRQK